MRILLTNDDGIYAPGIRAMREALKPLGTVIIVAPATEQSAVGHSVTLHAPLVVQEIFDDKKEFMGWAVEGRPADCVKLALLELLPERPDLIVSGINAGSNAGINVLYSGTVAAAVEGAFFRRTAIAFSMALNKTKVPDFTGAARTARSVLGRLLRENLPDGSLLNVNIPGSEVPMPKGVKFLPQNSAPYTESFDRRTDPRGRTYFWLGPDFGCPDPHPDTDEAALAEGFVTITPLKFDLTDHVTLARMRHLEWGFPEVEG